jgi:NAD(P)-dependent dehydrogenase (short-subunit alcohol dehydrogenase family)
MTNLANKTALVTGANRGMGRATALALAAAGARVIVHYGRNADEAKTVVDQIRAAGGRADAVSADLAAPDGAHTLATQVRNLIGDRLDILVSNAGNTCGMSALGQKQTLDWRPLMSALLPKADIAGRHLDVRFVPIADINSLFAWTCRAGSPEILGTKRLAALRVNGQVIGLCGN